jgi:mycothiol synthase
MLAVYQSMTESYTNSPFSTVDDYPIWAEEQQDLTAWHVAWDTQTGEIAGQVQAALYKGRGEIWEVSVRQRYRRRGLARALIVRGIRALQEQGITTARLHTLAENLYQSPRVYESIGFRILKRYPRYRKPMVRPRSPATGKREAGR